MSYGRNSLSGTTKVIGIISLVLLAVGVIFIFINPENYDAFFTIKAICSISLTLAALFPMCVIAQEDSDINPVPMMILSAVLTIAAIVYAVLVLSSIPDFSEYANTGSAGFIKLMTILYGVGGYFGLMLVNNNEYTPDFLDNIPDYIKIPLTYLLAPIVAVVLIVLDIYYRVSEG